MTDKKDLNYEIDFYIDGKRIDYFPPMGHDFSDRLEHIKDWAEDNGYPNYHIIVKRIDYWYLYKFSKKNNKFIEAGKIYLVQINTFDEIRERFSTERLTGFS